MLLDSAGSYSPVLETLESALSEKETTECFLLDLVFAIAEYFIFLVNDFTTIDQKALNKIKKSMSENSEFNKDEKKNEHIIVIHNLKDVYDLETLKHC